MRVFATLGFALLSGCSFLDQLALTEGSHLDPNKIYLGNSTIAVSAREVNAYACVDEPLMCYQRGIHFECSCPR